MNRALATTTRWMVSTRADGEVLTAGAGSDDLEFTVVGFPDRFTPEEIAGWLNDLTGVARETAQGDSSARTIPPLLHHALTGLLFSHAELWESDGITRPCSAAFVSIGDQVAFGWVGEALPEVWIDEGPLVEVYTRVRDDEGREALGIAFPASRRVRVRLSWSTLPGATDAPSGTVEAEWAGTFSPLEESLAMDTLAVSALVSSDAPASESPRPEPVARQTDAPEVAPAIVPIVPAARAARAPDALSEWPLESPAKRGFFGRIRTWLRRARPEDAQEFASTLEAPADESGTEMPTPIAPIAPIAQATPTAPIAPPVAAPPRNAPSPMLTADDVEVSPPDLHELLYPQTPAPPALAGGKDAIEDPHVRVLGPNAPPPARPVLHVPSVAPPASSGPPRLHVTRVTEDADAVLAEPPARMPGPPPLPRPTPTAESTPFEPPAPASPDHVIELDPRIEPALWEPPSSMIADQSAQPSEEEALAAALAALAAETATPPAAAAPPAPPAPPTPAPPRTPSLATSESMRAVLAARAAARSASDPDIEPIGSWPAPSAPPLPTVAPPAAPPRDFTRSTADSDFEPIGAWSPPPPAATAPPRAAAPPRATALPPAVTAPPRATAPPPPAATAPPRATAPPPPIAAAPARAASAPPAPIDEAAAVPPPVERVPLRPEWPSEDQLQAPEPLWKRPWVWIAAVVALFIGGWLVGGMSQGGSRTPRPNPFVALARGFGLGGARYDVMVNSRPAGAWIAVDGKDLARRTPATIDLPPGEHTVTLSLTDLGGTDIQVRGQRGDRVAIDAPLWGTLDVYAADGAPPVTVTFDGREVGFAPVHLDSVQPGAHDLRFSGPGMPAWGQPVEVRIAQKAEVVARPMTSPATGVIEVRASITDDEGTRSLSNAAVFVDGEPRGSTPLSLELPRGPHSVRVTYRDQSAPVQVIDLPGGNQRFANFELGVGAGGPRLAAVGGTQRFAIGSAATVSASLDGVSSTDAREMWLHVRTPEGAWRRYQMALLKSPTGVVGVAVFPSQLFDPGSRARWYASATVSTGDEYFTEILNAEIVAAPR